MKALQRELKYYREHQEELASSHHGELVLIVGESIEGFFATDLDAYRVATLKLGAESFLIRKCVRPEEEVTVVIHPRLVRARA